MPYIAINYRYIVLSVSEDGIILCSFILTQSRRVRTERWTELLYPIQRTALRRAVKMMLVPMRSNDEQYITLLLSQFVNV